MRSTSSCTDTYRSRVGVGGGVGACLALGGCVGGGGGGSGMNK